MGGSFAGYVSAREGEGRERDGRSWWVGGWVGGLAARVTSVWRKGEG